MIFLLVYIPELHVKWRFPGTRSRKKYTVDNCRYTTRTHTQYLYIYMYIYIYMQYNLYIYMCVCVCNMLYIYISLSLSLCLSGFFTYQCVKSMIKTMIDMTKVLSHRFPMDSKDYPWPEQQSPRRQLQSGTSDGTMGYGGSLIQSQVEVQKKQHKGYGWPYVKNTRFSCVEFGGQELFSIACCVYVWSVPIFSSEMQKIFHIAAK